MPISLVTFDLETSGLDPEKHEIIQIAAIAEGPSGEAIGRFQRKVQFSESFADPQALAVNHYDPEVWRKEAISRHEMAADFARWLRPYQGLRRTSKAGKPYSVAQLSGYNAVAFDIKFLVKHFQDTGAFLPCDMRVLDVLQLAMWRGFLEDWGIANYKLATVAASLGIESPADLHDAMADVELTIKVRKALSLEN